MNNKITLNKVYLKERVFLNFLKAKLHISCFARTGGANFFEHAQIELLRNIYMFARSERARFGS